MCHLFRYVSQGVKTLAKGPLTTCSGSFERANPPSDSLGRFISSAIFRLMTLALIVDARRVADLLVFAMLHRGHVDTSARYFLSGK